MKQKKPPSSARVTKQTRFEDQVLEQPKTSRPFNPHTDKTPDVAEIKFSRRIQSSRKAKSNMQNNNHDEVNSKRHLPMPIPTPVHAENAGKGAGKEREREVSVDAQLDSLMSALSE